MVAKINEKSTKPEIWAAYRALQAKLEAGPVAISNNDTKVNQLGVALEQAKIELLAQFETAREVANSAADDYALCQLTQTARSASRKAGLPQILLTIMPTLWAVSFVASLVMNPQVLLA